MKKAVLVLVVLLLLIILGGPFLAGSKTRQTLDNVVTFLNNQPGYTAEWLEYRKGWLTTDAVLRVALDFPAMSADDTQDVQNPEITFDVDVNHGPLILTDGFKVGWASGRVVLGEKLDSWIQTNLVLDNDVPFCTSDFTIPLSGAVDFSDQCQAGTVALEKGELRFESYQGEGHYSSNGLLEYQGTLPAVRMTSDDGFLEIGFPEIALALDFSRVYNDMLVPGDFSFSILHIRGESKENEAFNFSEFNMKSSMQFSDDNTMSDGSMEMSLVNASGFDMSLEDVKVVFEFERISLAFWDSYTRKAQELSESGDMAAIGNEMFGIMMTELLPAGPSLSIPELRFTTQDGSMNLTADFDVSPDAAQSADPMSIIQHISLQLDATADKPLALSLSEQSTLKELQAEQFENGEMVDDEALETQAKDMAEMKLNMLVVQGLLVEDRDRYKTSFSFKDGAATLNGQPMPLPF